MQDGGRHLKRLIDVAFRNPGVPRPPDFKAVSLRAAGGEEPTREDCVGAVEHLGPRRSRTSRVGSPSPMEILKERQKAMEVAASLGGSDPGSYRQTQEEPEQSESEQESELSYSSDRIGPDVKAGTSDFII
ncbi:hypothetical protein NDU88_000999 [Pleurodeles waltl]|uniref:Uncharacterized protein n=1 Tax=Pleurodeles waltl TaxID=8319 RepID=A0AAV7WL26_PLEWA|nr:hypothetical protein NDU88_000999 [Pleurodeles waltl]